MQARLNRQDGTLLCVIALLVMSVGNLLPFSFTQAQRDLIGCDQLCYGYLQSFASASSFVGAIFIGHLSDKIGRIPVIYVGMIASVLSCAVRMSNDSIFAMAMALIPSAFNQNHSVLKALFSDIAIWNGYDEPRLASLMGQLGMSAGLAFMIGPLLGAVLFSSYRDALAGSIALLIISAVMFLWLPKSSDGTNQGRSYNPTLASSSSKVKVPLSGKDNSSDAFSRVLGLFAVKTPGARLLLSVRMCMGFAYSIYNGVFMESLKTRFDFGPVQYGCLMAWVGLSYSISQGFIAKHLINTFKDDSRLLLCCACVLGIGRAIQMLVPSVIALYVVILCVISALGTMNTIISASTTLVAVDGSVGGLYGSMEAAEKLAALFGPAIGGVLFKTHPHLPVAADVFFYGLVFLMILVWYREHVILPYTEGELKPVVEGNLHEKKYTQKRGDKNDESLIKNKED